MVCLTNGSCARAQISCSFVNFLNRYLTLFAVARFLYGIGPFLFHATSPLSRYEIRLMRGKILNAAIKIDLCVQSLLHEHNIPSIKVHRTRCSVRLFHRSDRSLNALSFSAHYLRAACSRHKSFLPKLPRHDLAQC